MEQRNCIICNKVFTKPYSCSKNEWAEKHKTCSKECGIKSLKGRKVWNTGLKGVQVAWNKGRKSLVPAWNKGNGEYAKKLGFGKWMIGKKQLPETLKKKSDAAKKNVAAGTHNFYIDGRTPMNKALRGSYQYRLWREAVFARDNWTCQGEGCGKRGCYLEADHIKSWSKFPELRFAIDNGRTLCVPCHEKTPNYKGKALTSKI